MDDGHVAELYQRYGYLIHRRCRVLLGNAHDADDALQEVFLRAQKYAPTELPDAPLAWLYTIAQNCCWDLMKKRNREQPREHQEAPGDAERSTGSAHDADRRALMAAVLRKMDRRTRDIGVLHFLGGLTQEEVAAHTNLSRRTVGKKLHLFEVLFRQQWTAGGEP